MFGLERSGATKDTDRPRVLCVDDDDLLVRSLASVVRGAGYEPLIARSVLEAVEVAQRTRPDCVVADITMPDAPGTDLPRRLLAIGVSAPVVILTGDPSVERAVDAFRGGARHFLTKPFDPAALLEAIREVLDGVPVWRVLSVAGDASPQMIGDGRAMQALRSRLDAIAPTRVPVLIEGPSGVGKELLARLLHARSPAADGPFVAINCAAIPEGLVESTLFGHERGAFTGALKRSVGVFERAAGGTVLLDEITEMRPELQAKLLRVLQEGVLERVGGDRAIPTTARVIATSNRDLTAAVADGTLREDLYYRLSVVTLHLPPLQQRREDIPALVMHLVRELARVHLMAVPMVAADALQALQAAEWPGNVRQLRNVLERALLFARGSTIGVEHLGSLEGPLRQVPAPAAPWSDAAPATGRAHVSPDGPSLLLDSFDLGVAEERLIRAALQRTRGNRHRAALLLGINPRTLRRKLAVRPDLDPR
jgi:DNA-binding NtrC family response regulator